MKEQSTPRYDQTALARAYVEASPDGLLSVDSSGRICGANPQCEVIFGYPVDTIIGEPIEFLVPDSVSEAHRKHRADFTARPARRRLGVQGARFLGQRQDGSVVPIDIALSPIGTEGDGEILVIIRDLTMRLRAESEHNRVRAVLDALDEGVFLFESTNFEFSYVNSGAADQLGYHRDELTGGMSPIDILPPVDAEELKVKLNDLVAGRIDSHSLTSRFTRKDGTDFPVDVFFQYPRPSGSLERSLVAIAHDVTQREEAALALSISESAFKSAFDEAPVAMVLSAAPPDGRSTILDVNDAFLDLLGYESIGLCPTSLEELVHPRDLERNTRTASGPGTPLRFRRRSGEYVWGAVYESTIEAPDGSPRLLTHISDASQMVARENQQSLVAALGEIRQLSSSEPTIDQILDIGLGTVCRLASAKHAFIVVTSPSGHSTIRAMDSTLIDDMSGHQIDSGGLFSDSMGSARPRLVERLSDHGELGLLHLEQPLGVAVLAPCSIGQTNDGLLVVARTLDGADFDELELSNIEAVASEITTTIELGQARSTKRWMTLVEDRERIAHDLHDNVIQRLFATGMTLRASLSDPEALPDRVASTLSELDSTINEIRNTILNIDDSVRSIAGEVNRLITRHRDTGYLVIDLTVRGDLDAVPNTVSGHLLPTLNELLSNVERHAHAKHAKVDIDIDCNVTLVVSDDGIGIPFDHHRGFGLNNLTHRAAHLGGVFEVDLGAGNSGTSAVWKVPLVTPTA